MNIQTKEPEKKKTDNGTKSDKIDVNPRIDYHAQFFCLTLSGESVIIKEKL